MLPDPKHHPTIRDERLGDARILLSCRQESITTMVGAPVPSASVDVDGDHQGSRHEIGDGSVSSNTSLSFKMWTYPSWKVREERAFGLRALTLLRTPLADARLTPRRPLNPTHDRTHPSIVWLVAGRPDSPPHPVGQLVTFPRATL